MSYYQKTIQTPVECNGLGLHHGEKVSMKLLPASPGSGIMFVRRSKGQDVYIKASVDNVFETNMSTSIGKGAVHVHTVEHIAAACCGMQIDNLLIEIDGPEVPIMDGSARLFVDAIEKAGIAVQPAMKNFIKITKEIHMEHGSQKLSIYPMDTPRFSYTLNFPHPLLHLQSRTFSPDTEDFSRDIAGARTYCLYRDIAAIKQMGLAKGGSMDNAIVIGDDEVLNKDGLRYQDEFARHKILDIIGDLFLLGMPVIGYVVGEGSGHHLNIEMARKIKSSKNHRITATGAQLDSALELSIVS